MKTAFIILWDNNGQWVAEHQVWPKKDLAEAQMVLYRYQQPSLRYATVEVTLPDEEAANG